MGLVQTERLSPEPLSASEFNEMLETEKRNRSFVFPRDVTEEELRKTRELFATLYFQWRSLKPGESLSLEFD